MTRKDIKVMMEPERANEPLEELLNGLDEVTVIQSEPFLPAEEDNSMVETLVQVDTNLEESKLYFCVHDVIEEEYGLGPMTTIDVL